MLAHLHRSIARMEDNVCRYKVALTRIAIAGGDTSEVQLALAATNATLRVLHDRLDLITRALEEARGVPSPATENAAPPPVADTRSP